MLRRSLIAMAPALALAASSGCNDSEPTGLAGVQQLLYLTRTGGETGNVFDYTRGGAATDRRNIFTLTPPTARARGRT